MAKILPFQGYRYNKEIVDNLGKVTASPYDTLKAADLNSLYELSEYNFARIARGKTFDSDNETTNRHTRAAAELKSWIENDVLIREEKPAIYMYSQEHELNHTVYTTMGFVALIKLEDFNSPDSMVTPCEETKEVSTTDLYSALLATNTNLSMINCLYSDFEKHFATLETQISEGEPDAKFVASDGTKQKVWVITDEEIIKKICDGLADKHLYLVDGQNRYSAAWKYRNTKKGQNPDHTGNEPYNYIMALLTNAYEDGILQVPYHRVVTFPNGFHEDFFTAAVQDNFKIEKIIVDINNDEIGDVMKKQIATVRRQNIFAVYTGKNYFYRITFIGNDALKNLMPDKSDGYRSLDTTVFNSLVLTDIFNIPEEKYNERVVCIGSISKAIELVKNDPAKSCLFCMNPVKVEQIRSVAMNGERMPERSVCMFPKAATGVIINVLD